MSGSVWPHGLQHTRLPCSSLSPGLCSSSCPLILWCHPTTSSSVTPFSSCLQSLPASGSFPMSWLFPSGGQSIGASVLASVLPMNIQHQFPLGLTGLIALLSKGLSRVWENHYSLTNWNNWSPYDSATSTPKSFIMKHHVWRANQITHLLWEFWSGCRGREGKSNSTSPFSIQIRYRLGTQWPEGLLFLSSAPFLPPGRPSLSINMFRYCVFSSFSWSHIFSLKPFPTILAESDLPLLRDVIAFIVCALMWYTSTLILELETAPEKSEGI